MASSSPLRVFLVGSDQRSERWYDVINGIFITEEKAQTFLRDVEEEYLEELEECDGSKFTRDDLRGGARGIPECDGFHLEMPLYEAHIYLWELDTNRRTEIKIKHD
eukprot:TRINITY_DN5376_c0_g2_i1.p2 TRINITY_DN5376_c0_g2~~TRINITY_DN5376_c0_g2_i1.p2  ORF type:complete len:106 (+),score=27.32 TRINITY_DN5376_c0_g2_i1:148-465(+)